MRVAVIDIMTARFELYVPTHLLDQEFRKKVAALIGGYTEVQARGTWLTDRYNLTQEPITIICMQCQRKMAQQVRELIVNEIRRLLDSGEQAVALSIDGSMFLYGLMTTKKETT